MDADTEEVEEEPVKLGPPKGRKVSGAEEVKDAPDRLGPQRGRGEAGTEEVQEAPVKLGPPKGRKRKLTTPENLPRKRRRRVPTTQSQDNYFHSSPEPPIPPSLQSNTQDKSPALPRSSQDSLLPKPPRRKRPLFLSSSSPSRSPSPQPIRDERDELEEEEYPDGLEELEEPVEPFQDPPSPSRTPSRSPTPVGQARSPEIAEQDEEEVQNSLIDEMEESYLNFSPTGPVRSPLRASQREQEGEIVQETVRISIVMYSVILMTV